MTVKPGSRPDTMPVLLTVATETEPEAHVPPASASDNAVVSVVHTVVVPVMAEGKGLTVSMVVMKQPAGNV